MQAALWNNIIPDAGTDLQRLSRPLARRPASNVAPSTNNFPEFTGRICPAPCEAACVLGISEPPVAIKVIERTVVDHAWEQGWIHPEPASHKSGKRVAVVGSGPAGLAAAQQLARAGHAVTVFEKADRLGGLLRYGIPDFKMEKHWIDRRLDQMRAEGVEFLVNTDIRSLENLRPAYQAVVLAMGAEHPRDLHVPGRELKGIHFAMDFLPQQNKRVAGDKVSKDGAILATGKNVIIIGGGDTGADCLGTSHRQKAKHVHQFEIMPTPPVDRSPLTPWPLWPLQLRQESSHEEGGQREWAVATTHFTGDLDGNVEKLHGIRVGPPPKFEAIPGSEFTLDADLVLLAMGFTGPVKHGLIEQAALRLDHPRLPRDRGLPDSMPGVFAAGDARRGQSLVCVGHRPKANSCSSRNRRAICGPANGHHSRPPD